MVVDAANLVHVIGGVVSTVTTATPRLVMSTVSVAFGAAGSPHMASFPSTVTVSTAVGVAGAAAAPPATPEIYLKVLIPKADHSLSTGYIPVYLST